MKRDDWEGRWKDGTTGWHLATPHSVLTSQFDKLLGSSRPEEVKILVPLCGKTVDLKWLHDKGLTVYGTEFSDIAIKQFFEENGMSFTTKTLGELVSYESEDRRLVLLQGDMFRVTTDHLGGQVDAVWDRGAFEAINMDDKEKYVSLIADLLKPSGKILLSGFVYDKKEHSGQPFPVTPEDAQKYYGPHFKVERVYHNPDEIHHPTLGAVYRSGLGLTWIHQNGYLMTR